MRSATTTAWATRPADDVVLDVRLTLTAPLGLLCELDGIECPDPARFRLDVGDEIAHYCPRHTEEVLTDLAGQVVRDLDVLAAVR